MRIRVKLNESKTKPETALLHMINSTQSCNASNRGRRAAVTPAPHRPLSRCDREYFRALREAEMKVWTSSARPEVNEIAREDDVKPWLARLFHLVILLAVAIGWLAPQPGQASETNSNVIAADYARVLRSGDCRQLRQALERGASPNARDAAGNTPLMLAAVYGDAACLELLLDKGADVNATNKAGATALMRAAYDYSRVSLLVRHGADVNARSALGNTPLMLAARSWNSHRAVELLLARGADASAANLWGATALMAAVAGGDEASVQMLLQHGANANAQPGMDVPSFLLGGGRSALMWSAYRGDDGLVKMLLDAGADINGEGFAGTPLEQAAWGNHTSTARLLLDRGAQVNQTDHGAGYTALHWAASSEQRDTSLVNLLLEHGADPNLGAGAHVDAFMDILQTPLMLARRRGESPLVAALIKAGATNETPDRLKSLMPPARNLPDRLDDSTVRAAVSQAVPLLQKTSTESKQSFVNHASHQDCVSCHQQFLPLAAIGAAKKYHVAIDQDAERELIAMVQQGDMKNAETDWQPLFHPDAVHTKGYALFGEALDDLPASELTDAMVHHLAAIQGKDGRWYNNLPRPPLQSSDVGATALAIHALQRYTLPGRKAELSGQVERARRWLCTIKAETQEERAYQLLGLGWAGESKTKLQPLAKALLAEQRADGGWSQLAGTGSDAYATGQVLYALRIAAGLENTHPAIDRGRRFLLQTQLADGTWYVRRRAFPFQPTMNSGFPHGKDSWISAAATSWAVLALSLPDSIETLALKQ
jgi:ankyrin repeat protein